MWFTFCLFQFNEKKKNALENGEGVGLASPVPSHFVYGPVERTENLSKMVYNLLECSKSVAEDEVDEIMANYSNISQLKVDMPKIPTRQLRTEKSQKKELFNESKLRINLGKLSGYESKLEVYSCQRYFLNIYERTTPKRMMTCWRITW